MLKARTAKAQWNGNLASGKGTIALGSGAYEGQYSFQSRFESGTGTNPEELIAGAHAGCFSMAFAHALASAGYTPTRISTSAAVHLAQTAGGFEIPLIELATEGEVPGIDEATFRQQAEAAKAGCPVSKALAGPEIKLTSIKLVGG